jgi:hypothetical protein
VVGFLITSATIIAYESILNIRIAHDSPKPWTLLVLGQLFGRVFFSVSDEKSVEMLALDAWHQGTLLLSYLWLLGKDCR